jgi:hypothetical protein
MDSALTMPFQEIKLPSGKLSEMFIKLVLMYRLHGLAGDNRSPRERELYGCPHQTIHRQGTCSHFGLKALRQYRLGQAMDMIGDRFAECADAGKLRSGVRRLVTDPITPAARRIIVSTSAALGMNMDLLGHLPPIIAHAPDLSSIHDTCLWAHELAKQIACPTDGCYNHCGQLFDTYFPPHSWAEIKQKYTCSAGTIVPWILIGATMAVGVLCINTKRSLTGKSTIKVCPSGKK